MAWGTNPLPTLQLEGNEILPDAVDRWRKPAAQALQAATPTAHSGDSQQTPTADSGDIAPPNSGDTDASGQAAENVPHGADGPAGSDRGFLPSRKASDHFDSGELKWFLGCKVEQDKVRGIVRLTQEQYRTDILKRFQMDNCTL